MIRKFCKLLENYPRTDGRGVSVAIIDSGVEAGHPDLAGAQISGVVITERFGQFLFSDYDGEDVAGHGTACAARVLKVAPAARIVSCRILNRSVQSTSQALLVALKWVVQQDDIDVVNLSLGTPNREFGLDIAEQVDALYAKGVPVVVARGYEDRPDYPSAFGTPVSVTAERTDNDDDLIFHSGSVVEFGARGYNVEVPWRAGKRLTVNGSSFAAPLIAGRIARLKNLHPAMRVWDVKALLVEQATATTAAQSAAQSEVGSESPMHGEIVRRG